MNYLEDFDFDLKNKVLIPSSLPQYKDKTFIIMVMADWCTHCKNAKPEYENLLTDLDIQSNPNIILSYVNTTGKSDTENKLGDIASKFFKNLPGYPTFIKCKNGKEIETYNGSRNKEGFKKFALN